MTQHTSETRKNFFIIHNPNSGGKSQKLFKKTCALLEKNIAPLGGSLTTVQTMAFGDGAQISGEAAKSGKYDAIIAVGGDGTIQDVATGMLGSPVPLGIIPAGTGNVLVRELNYKFSPKFLVDNLISGNARPVHVGLANDIPFLFAGSVGYDAEVVEGFDKGNGRKLGRAGYALPGMKALLNKNGGDLIVTTENGRQEADWVIVTRVRFYASDFLLRPNADISSDIFHVVCFKGKGKFTRMRQLIGLATGRLPKNKSVSFETAKTVRVEGNPDNYIQIDGESLGQLPLTFTIHPKTLKVIAPLA